MIKMRGLSLIAAKAGRKKFASIILFIMFFRRVVIFAAKSLSEIRVMDAFLSCDRKPHWTLLLAEHAT